MVWHSAPERVRWQVRDALTMDIHRALNEAGIVIPFPQRTVWFNNNNSSPPTSASELEADTTSLPVEGRSVGDS